VTEPSPSTISGARRSADAVAAYEASFGKLCAGTVAPLLAAAHLRQPAAAGRRVLDAGTGTGSVAVAAAACGARVTAVDSDAELVAAARSRLPHVSCLAADVTELPFRGGQFDVVLANFVVNHLADPRAGMAELSRVLAGGGTIALTIWGAGPSVMKTLWDDVVGSSGAIPPAAQRLPPDKDFPRTADGLSRLLTGAGLTAVQVRTVKWLLRIDADQFWSGPAAGLAGIGSVVMAQSPQVQAKMKQEYDRLVQPLLVDGQLELPSWALLASAVKPAN
jgi:SAM-dependent methyltransferase